MKAFLDESGTNPEMPILSVAGCYGTKDQWNIFRDMWEPHSEGFHARESTRSFPLICEAIERASIDAMLVTVSKEEYRSIASSHLKTAFGNAYSTCALVCAEAICQAVVEQEVAFVIEHGQPNLGFVRGILELMMADKDCVASVTVAKKNHFIELHTADFISHISSSNDHTWLDRLSNRIVHAPLEHNHLKDASVTVTELFRKARKMRKALAK